MIYLANAFSPNMINMPAAVEFEETNLEEFCSAVKSNSINAIGHQGTVGLINQLCGTNIVVNRISIKAGIGDLIYIIMLSVRLEEGKVLGSQELEQMLKEGKIKFVKAKIYGAVLGQLAECHQKCDEKYYDYLAEKAIRG